MNEFGRKREKSDVNTRRFESFDAAVYNADGKLQTLLQHAQNRLESQRKHMRCYYHFIGSMIEYAVDSVKAVRACAEKARANGAKILQKTTGTSFETTQQRLLFCCSKIR